MEFCKAYKSQNRVLFIYFVHIISCITKNSFFAPDSSLFNAIMNLTQNVSDRVLRMQESATLKMSKLARALRAEGKDVINLSLGEPDFDTPDHIKQAAKKALDEGYTKYTPVPGLPELRKAICDKFERDNQLSFDLDQIVVSNGAKQSIANLSLALLDEGDEVIIFTPYWVSYFEIVRISGATPIPLAAGIDNDYKVTAEQLEEAITSRTKMVLFSSPCNPTGSVFSKEELEAISLVIQKHPQIITVSDEIADFFDYRLRLRMSSRMYWIRLPRKKF